MKNSTPLISVVIPVYNAERYLDECLKAITNQTFKDIEIICVDDGSTDVSLKILLEYEKNDKRVKVISKKNQGVNYARRDGVAIAKGEWIAFVDADDLIARDYLSDLIKPSTSKVDVVIGGTVVINERVTLKFDSKPVTSKLISDKEEIYRLFIRLWKPHSDGSYIIPISPWSKIIRREVIAKNDWYISNYSSGNDSLMMRQIFQNMKGGLLIIDKPLYFYYALSYGLGSKKLVTTNVGSKITRLEYEMERYDIDEAYAKEKKYDLGVDIILGRLNILHNFLEDYIAHKTLTSDDKIYVNKIIRDLSVDFNNKTIQHSIDINGFDRITLEKFYSIVRDQGMDSYIDYYHNQIITEKDRIIAEKDKIITEKDRIIAEKDKIITSILNSRSWSITKPLRNIRRKL